MVEAIFHADRHDLRRDRADRPALFGNDQAVGLGQRSQHRFAVERAQCAQIEHLGFDPLTRQGFSGFEREADADRIGHDRHVLAFAHNPGLADRQDMIVQFGQFEVAAIDQFVFQEDHRIVAADRGLKQALGVRSIVRRDHDQAGDAGVPRTVVLAVLRADPAGRRVGATEYNWAAHLSA